MTALDFSCPCGFRAQPRVPPAEIPVCPDCKVPLEPFVPPAWILASRQSSSTKGPDHV